MGSAGRAVAAIPAFKNERRLQRGESDEDFILTSIPVMEGPRIHPI
jgi:hypothetical protein